MMFHDILLPLDGSRFAERAFPFATRLARGARARLHLVLAREPEESLVPAGYAVLLDEGHEDTLPGREASYLAETAARLQDQGVSQVAYRELSGPPGLRLCEEAGRLNADLVVMETHSRGALGRLWLGSLADQLVRHLNIPVVLLHPDLDRDEHWNRPVHGILVALDLSSTAEAILAPVIALAQLSQAHVTLIHVVEHVFEIWSLGDLRPSLHDPENTQASRIVAQHRLDQVADRLSERGLSVSTRVVVGINAAGGLLETLDDDRYDVLALTTHGAGEVRRLVLGSVADQVIRHTAKPVLVLRPLPEN
jgi:nucleotide-binding universal stress UspA family protein